MTGRYFAWVVGGIFVAASLVCAALADDEPNGLKEVKVNRKVADAARATLQATEAAFADIENVYRWSRRVVEAEQFSDQAVKEHAARMEALYRKTASLKKNGVPGGEEERLHAAVFYLAEAEAWLKP